MCCLTVFVRFVFIYLCFVFFYFVSCNCFCFVFLLYYYFFSLVFHSSSYCCLSGKLPSMHELIFIVHFSFQILKLLLLFLVFFFYFFAFFQFNSHVWWMFVLNNKKHEKIEMLINARNKHLIVNSCPFLFFQMSDLK